MSGMTITGNTMPQLSDYKALLFDVDNTLVANGVLFETVCNALKELQKRQYVCGICTGRGYLSVQSYLEELFTPDSLHIITGGAQIISASGKVIYEQKIAAETAQKIYKLIQEHKAEVMYKTTETYFCTPEILSNMMRESRPIHTTPIAELKQWSVNMITAYHLNSVLEEALLAIPDISIKRMLRSNNEPFFDITPKGVTKQHSLEVWSKTTCIPLEQIIGFGDSENDIEFLSTVGYSVAMGNAIEPIKRLADKVIGHIDTDGLGAYLTGVLSSNEL